MTIQTDSTHDPLAALRRQHLSYELVRDLTGLRDTRGMTRLDTLESLLQREDGGDALVGLFLVGARRLLIELSEAPRDTGAGQQSALDRATSRLAHAGAGDRRQLETASNAPSSLLQP